MISADILLKGLAGVATVGGAAGMGVCYHQKLWIFAEGENLKSMGEKVGLDCTGTNGQKEETGVDCTIDEKVGLSVKQNDTTKDTGKKKDTAQTGTSGKIKGYKDGKGFKFVIEGGDIALKEGTATPNTNISKLEQFETYEIKEDEGDKKQYLTRKTEAKDGIKKSLGLDQIESCDLPDSTTNEKTCALDANKVKKINFDGKDGEPTVVDATGAATLSLQLKIATETEKTIFPHGYKFTLVSNRDINLGGDKSIKKDTNTEFKIKVTPASGGPKLTLEKAWNVTELGKKVGLTCPAGEKKECTLGTGININNGTASDATKKLTGLSKKANTDDKVVKYEENVGDHNQGIKFFVDGTSDIELQGGSSGTDDDKKILKKTGDNNNQISYEIKKDGTNNNTWYLTKKTTTTTPT